MTTLGAYRAMLVLYPRAFREAYGEDMVQLVADQLRDESHARVLSRIALDLAVSVPTRQLEARMKRPSPLLIPTVFAALSVAAAATATLVGVQGGISVVCLAASVIFGVVAFGALRTVRLGGSDDVTSHWWKFMLAGAIGIAGVFIVGTAFDDLPDGGWYALMGGVLVSFTAAAAGIVLGIARIVIHRRATPA